MSSCAHILQPSITNISRLRTISILYLDVIFNAIEIPYSHPTYKMSVVKVVDIGLSINSVTIIRISDFIRGQNVMSISWLILGRFPMSRVWFTYQSFSKRVELLKRAVTTDKIYPKSFTISKLSKILIYVYSKRYLVGMTLWLRISDIDNFNKSIYFGNIGVLKVLYLIQLRRVYLLHVTVSSSSCLCLLLSPRYIMHWPYNSKVLYVPLVLIRYIPLFRYPN